MENPINPKLIYFGKCLGCKHLHRMHQFSRMWYCDLEHKPNDNGKSWREEGRKMKKCEHYENYTENRCIDCKLAYSTSFNYWHCKLDHHCFNYTESACEYFNGSQEDYNKDKQIKELQEKVESLVKLKVTFISRVKELNQSIANLQEELEHLKL